MTKEERMEKKNIEMIKRDEYEMKNLGNYSRIYPDVNADMDYDIFIKASIEQWELFTGGRKKILQTIDKFPIDCPNTDRPKTSSYFVQPLKPRIGQEIPSKDSLLSQTLIKPAAVPKPLRTVFSMENVYGRLTNPDD